MEYQRYRELEGEYRQRRRNKQFREADVVLDGMIRLMSENAKLFDEAEDRIRINRARKAMMCYEQKRMDGSIMELVRLLRQAAELGTPSVCSNQPCAKFNPSLCLSRKKVLSKRQGRMCIEKISNVCDALKLEAQFAAGGPLPDLDLALTKRREAAVYHQTILQLDPTKERLSNQQYLDYWRYVTEGQVALHKGKFGRAGQWFQKAAKAGRKLDSERCFPNFFHDVRELEVHQIYIDALSDVREQKFGHASDLFTKWLNLFPDRGRKYDVRYDNMKIYQIACDILERLPKGTVDQADWDTLAFVIENVNPSLPTWTLIERLSELHAQYLSVRRRGANWTQVSDNIRHISTEWTLFVPDSQLLSVDKTAGLQRSVNVPSFLDVFDRLDRNKHNWKEVLLQNLTNLFLLMAEYEYKRYLNPPDEERVLPRSPKSVPPSEKDGVKKLSAFIIHYLERRSKEHKTTFDRALRYLESFQRAINSDDFNQAVAIQKQLFEVIRSWPHTIQVEEQNDSQDCFREEHNSVSNIRATHARRLWNREPRKITFIGAQDLERSKFYYLRPNWNIKLSYRYQIRHEQFHESDVVGCINTFFENIFGNRKVNASRFQDWIFQFARTERLLACRLLNGLRYYDNDRIKPLWIKVFRKLPSEAKRNVAYIGLGHGAKSGRLNPPCFRQAISKLPEYGALFGGRESKIFRDMAEFEKKELGLPRPNTIVFLDDFIGTGGQAKKFLEWYFRNYDKSLDKVAIYLCVLVGFTKAIDENVKEPLKGRIKDVIVGEELDERDRAFSPSNSIWQSEQQCRDAEQWAKEIGYQLLATSDPVHDAEGNLVYDPARDALGWHGCQALVAFHHNTPSDTLPIFWGKGTRNGNNWKSLLDRHD